MAYVDEQTKRYFLSLKPEDLGIKMQTSLFSSTVDPETKKISPPKYNVTDRVKLKANEYINKTNIDTTLGRIVFNKICIEPYIANVIPDGYWNIPLDKKAVGKLYDCVASALKYEKISMDAVWAWEKAIEFYSLKGAILYNPSYTSNMLMPKKDIIKTRDEFFKEHPNAQTVDYVNLEKKLTKMAENELKDDPAIGLYRSGARGTMDDQYKNITSMIGPVYNPATGQMEPVKSNLIEGFSKEDLPKAGNMIISAQYPKSNATADSGYITKQYYAAFQAVCVDEDGTDCHTTSHLKILLTEGNWKRYELQNMITERGIVTLTQDNYKSYVGKIIKLRSPMCCTNPTVCSVCAGRLPYISDIKYIGVTFATVPNAFVNAGMKKFHKSAVNFDEVDPNRLIF